MLYQLSFEGQILLSKSQTDMSKFYEPLYERLELENISGLILHEPYRAVIILEGKGLSLEALTSCITQTRYFHKLDILSFVPLRIPTFSKTLDFSLIKDELYVNTVIKSLRYQNSELSRKLGGFVPKGHVNHAAFA